MVSASMLDNLMIDMPDEQVYDIGSMGEGIVLRTRGGRKNFQLSPENAAKFLNYPEFTVNDTKVDRNLSEAHVVHLAREMLAGNFRWEQVNLVLAEIGGDGQLIRMNGQHCSWARLCADEQGLPKDTNCPVNLMIYECETVEDARRLYASLDRGRPRGQGTVVNSLMLGTDEFAGVPGSVLKLVASGLGFWKWEKSHTRALHGGDDLAYVMLREELKVSQQVCAFIQEAKTKEFHHLKRSPVVAAMLATFHKHPGAAHEFWSCVKDGLNMTDKADPKYCLRDWLLRASLSRHQTEAKGTFIVNQEQMYRTCLVYWNAYRKNKQLKKLMVDLDGPRPEVL